MLLDLGMMGELGPSELRSPMSLLGELLASLQTGNDLAGVGYATVYPLATVLTVVLAQPSLALLN